MPTSQSSLRPSSTMSDENSDFEYDDDDDDVEAVDAGSGDEKSAEFIVPSVKKSNSENTKKVISNGVKKPINDNDDDNELIICENSSSNSVGFGGSSAGFDPLDTDEKDPLDLQSADSNDVVVPVIKLRASKDEGWKIKRKSDPVETVEELPAKRVRTNRSVVSYVEIDDDDDDPKMKSRGRPRRDAIAVVTQPPKPALTPKASQPTKALQPSKASQPAKTSQPSKVSTPAKTSQPSKLATPAKTSQPSKASQSTKTSPTTRASLQTKAASPTKATQPQKTSTPAKASQPPPKVSKPLKVLPEKKERPPPTPASTGKRGRRKRRDSEDSFEILPFKRRQFRGVEVEEEGDATNADAGEDLTEVEDVDEETKEDVLRTSTPTPTTVETKTETRRSKASKKSATVEDVKNEPVEVKEESQPLPEETTNEPPSLNDSAEKIPKKRGRPRKSDQLLRSTDVTLDTMSRDSFSSSLRQRKSRMSSSVMNFSCLDDEETRMTFGFDDSTLDFLDFSDDTDFKPPKRSQARPGPVKNIDQTFPRLTAEELVS